MTLHPLARGRHLATGYLADVVATAENPRDPFARFRASARRGQKRAQQALRRKRWLRTWTGAA